MTDETEAQNRGTSQQGDSSGGEGSTSPAESFTKAQLDKAVSDALARAGRSNKDLEAREAKISDGLKAIEEHNRRQAEAEEEKFRNDPDGLAKLRKDRELKERERRLNDQESLTKAEKEELAQLRQERAVSKIAKEKGVDADLLMTKSADLGLTDAERISKLADTLAALPKEPTPPAEAPKTPTLHVDSGRSNGGGKDFSKMSGEEKIRYAQEHPPKK
jgi:Skp family chaperone for outer membrane proteins